MAIRYYCGDGWKTVSFARKDMGADAYLFCPGPSLEHVSDADIHVPGVMVFAVNTAYPRIRPDVWIGMDVKEKCYDKALWSEPFRKICRAGRSKAGVDGKKICEFPEVYWADVSGDNIKDIFNGRAHDSCFVYMHNTLTVACHIMVWMGAKRIHFVGCDQDNSKKDYHDNRKLHDRDREENFRLYKKQTKFLRQFMTLGLQHGIECISCTPGSPINEFMDYVPLQEALRVSQEKSPKRGYSEILNTREVERKQLQQWGTPELGRGVVVAFNENMEWMGEWWWENLRRHVDVSAPVAFVDLGMSPPMRKWCENRGRIIDFTWSPIRPDGDKKTFRVEHGWKPFVFFKSPFRETLFLDVDCEVVGDVLSVFEHLGKNRFGIAKDQLYHQLKSKQELLPGEVMHNSGVLAVRHGSKIVEQWAKAIIDVGVDGWRDNDQPILNKVLTTSGIEYAEIPPEYNLLAPYAQNWKSRCKAEVVTSPKVLHRLTSHPHSFNTLRTILEERFCVDGIWLRDADIFLKCLWANEAMADKGVVIGVDANQEWMIPWWVENYRRHNNYPVLVADFGLTDDGIELCRQLNLGVSATVSLEGHGWFKKPLGCLQTIFKKTVWMDTDVEVRKDIGPLFDYSENNMFGITYDRGTPQQYKDAMPWDATIYNSGCISYRHNDPLIQKWAMITVMTHELKPQPGKLFCVCGDQETLAMAIRRYAKHRIHRIPKEDFALRLSSDPDDCIAKHWTGPTGKKVIKQQMADSRKDIGVMVGLLDEDTEWLLEWWYANYKRYNDLPVCFVDCGMSDSARAFCEERGRIVKLVTKPHIKSWFRKPWALLETPFQRTLFIETDVEVRGNIRDLIVNTGGLGMVYERSTKEESVALKRHFGDKRRHNVPDDALVYDGGQLVFNSDEPMLQRWADAVEETKHLPACNTDNSGPVENGFVGDHEILAKVMYEMRKGVHIMPRCANKYYGPPKDSLLYHRCGYKGQGKDSIKRQTERKQLPETSKPKSVVEQDKGVLVGILYEDTEQMLDWWMGNYLWHNSLPVCFVGYKTTPETREKCEAWGIFIDISDINFVEGRWKRPFAMQRTPFKHTVWIDIDCEVRGNVGRLLDMKSPSLMFERRTEKLTMVSNLQTTADPRQWANVPSQAKAFDAGVVRFDKGCDLIAKWCERCKIVRRLPVEMVEDEVFAEENGFVYDQEVLSLIVHENQVPVGWIPNKNCRNKHYGDSGVFQVYHRCGGGLEGKGGIRKQIREHPIVIRHNSLVLACRKDLLARMGQNVVCCEVGVGEGELSVKINSMLHPKKLHLVDLWKHQEEGYEDENNVSDEEHARRKAHVEGIFKNCANVQIHQGWSTDVVAQFPNHYFDFVYIDANHYFDPVLADLEAYAPKVKKNGFLCGHDYAGLNPMFEVEEAVQEFCNRHNWRLLYTTDEEWPSFVLRRL